MLSGVTKTKLDILKSTHVNPRPFLTIGRVTSTVLGEEAVKDDIVVDLGDDVGQVVMFFEECQELGRRPVDGHEPGIKAQVPEHVIKECLATARSLSGLVDVEIKDAHWTHFHLVSIPIQEEQIFPAHLQES